MTDPVLKVGSIDPDKTVLSWYPNACGSPPDAFDDITRKAINN